MPRLPGPEALGNLPSMRSGSGPPQVSGRNPVAEGLARVGQGMVALDDERRKEDESARLSQADAHLTTGLIDLNRRFQTDPDYNTYPERFTADAERIRTEAEGIIGNPRLVERWRPRASVDISRTYDGVLRRGDTLRQNQQYDDVDRDLDGLSTRYLSSTDDEERGVIRQRQHEVLEFWRHRLPDERWRQLRQRHIYEPIEQDVRQRGYAAYLELLEGDQRLRQPSTGEISELGLARLEQSLRAPGQTPAQTRTATARLRTEVTGVSQWIRDNVTQPLTQAQHDALVGFSVVRGRERLEELRDLLNSQGPEGEQPVDSIFSALRGPGLAAEEQPAGITGSGPGAQPRRTDVAPLGSVSARYESGGRGVGFVSSGRGDPGGPSYGVHQLSGVASMPAFLRSQEGAPYRAEFGNAQPMTPEFNRIYQQIATRDPEGFAAAQHAFYTRTHYEPARAVAERAGFDVGNRAIQEAVFSIGVQHAGARTIIQQAAAAMGQNATVEQQIRALYDARTNYVDGLTTLPEGTRQSVLQRYQNEVRDVLALAGGDGPPVAGGDQGRPVRVAQAPTGTRTDAGLPAGAPGTRPRLPGSGPDERVEEFADLFRGQASSPRYSDLPSHRRRVLIGELRKDLVNEASIEVENDISEIQRTGQPRRLPDGTTWIGRASRILVPNQAARVAHRVQEAYAQFRAVHGLSNMTPAQMSERNADLDRVGEGEHSSIARRVRDRALRTERAILDLRQRDSSLAVSGTQITVTRETQRMDPDGRVYNVPAEDDLRVEPAHEVTAAFELLRRRRPDLQIQITENGEIVAAPVPGRAPAAEMRPQTLQLTDPRLTAEDRRVVVEARLQAMTRLQIPDHYRRILSQDEAARLLNLPSNLGNMQDDQFESAVMQAADRAAQMFGPRYARAAFTDAIAFWNLNERRTSIVSGVAQDLPGGLTPEDDMDRLRTLRRLDREEAIWQYGAPTAPTTPGGWLEGMTGLGTMPLYGVPRPAAAQPQGWFGGRTGPAAEIGPAPERETEAVGPGRSVSWPKPTAQDIEDIRQYPHRQRVFDQRFGPGATARALQR